MESDSVEAKVAEHIADLEVVERRSASVAVGDIEGSAVEQSTEGWLTEKEYTAAGSGGLVYTAPPADLASSPKPANEAVHGSATPHVLPLPVSQRRSRDAAGG